MSTRLERLATQLADVLIVDDGGGTYFAMFDDNSVLRLVRRARQIHEAREREALRMRVAIQRRAAMHLVGGRA